MKNTLQTLPVVAVLTLLATTVCAETVLITGSNRGIGFEFAKQYAERGWTVLATCRNPDDADELNALAEEHDSVSVYKLDVTSSEQAARLAAALDGKPIDVLINNAGLVDLGPRQEFGQVDYDLVDRMIEVNALGALRVAEALVDNVAASDEKKLVNITSSAGSIGAIQRPGFMGYRASKAAMNSIMKNLSLTLADRGIVVGLINPGTVDTRGILDMTEETAPPEYQQAIKMIEAGVLKMQRTPDAVSNLIGIINGLTAEDSGRFINHDGETLPW